MTKIQRLSTMTYRLISPKGRVIMIDPWLTQDPIWPLAERAQDKLAQVETIVITHAHFDHSSGIEEIVKANNNVQVLCQFELAMILLGKGIKNVFPVNKGGTAEVNGIKYSMVGADHTSSLMTGPGAIQMVGTAAGFVIEMEDGFKIYAAGDTGLTSDMKLVVADYFKPHLAILPVIGTLMMEPEQAVICANIIKPKYVIPSHDFPEKFEDAASPEGYQAFCQQFPIALQTRAKTRKFLELMKKRSRAKVITLDFGESAEIK